MSIVNFIAQYDGLTNNTGDTVGDIGTVAAIGPVRFVPLFTTGTQVPAPGYTPRPAGFAFRTFYGYLDADGRLKNERGGTPGVSIWANDPVFTGVPRLQYRVEADLTDPLGEPIPFNSFCFDAPDPTHSDWPNATVNLALELPRPGQKFGRGRPGFSLVDLDVIGLGELMFILTDGAELGPVAVPELAEALTAAAAAAVSYTMTFGA